MYPIFSIAFCVVIVASIINTIMHWAKYIKKDRDIIFFFVQLISAVFFVLLFIGSTTNPGSRFSDIISECMGFVAGVGTGFFVCALTLNTLEKYKWYRKHE